MAVANNHISIFGFGSFYDQSLKWNDIDILILHDDLSDKSIAFAIDAKRIVKSCIENVDVSILSRREEKQIDFINKANAQFLGRITELDFRSSVCIDKIRKIILQK